jgi:uncharacterized membrane protein (UPF0127 family)
LALYTGAQAGLLEPAPTFEVTKLVIDSGAKCLVFQVEVARTTAARRQGLQGRQELAADAGMLFLLEKPRTLSMWMKDTFIPLDILFIDANGRITEIVERTAPRSRTRISPQSPTAAVLELLGGTVRRLAIEPGDCIETPLPGAPRPPCRADYTCGEDRVR